MPHIKELSKSPESQENVHRSVRVFAVAPIREEQLDALFEKHTSPNDFSLVEIILVKKSDSGWVTTLGGEIRPSEDIFHAGMQRVFEKSLLTRESLRDFKDNIGSGSPIPYTVNKEGEHIEALFEVMQVRSGSVSLHEPREKNGEVDNIEQLVSVNPRELHELFKTGSVTTQHGEHFYIDGHLTQAETGDVSMDPNVRRVQKHEFARILDDMYVYEQNIRALMREHINRVRRWYHKPQISSLGECGREEIKRAFFVAQITLGFTDERKRDADKANMPPPSADLPTASLYYREISPDQLPDALISVPTQEVRRVRNVLKYALRGTVAELYERMGRDMSPYMTKKPFFPLHMRDIADFIARKPQSLSYLNTVAALRAIWPDVVTLRADKLAELLSFLDARFTAEMAQRLKKPMGTIQRALKKPDSLPKYLAKELTHSHERFQLDHPTNEAANAIERPFVQILHILGLHPYIPISPEFKNEAVKRMRGEILMQEALVFPAIPVIERNDRADNSIFEIGVARFLEYPPELDELILKHVPHTILARTTKEPVGDRELQLWYEKRPLKEEDRMLLKSFQESDFYDDFSVNFVIRDINFSETERYNIPLRLAMVDTLGDALVTHFETELAGSGWKVDIIPGTYKRHVLDAIQTYMKIQSPEEREKFMNDQTGGERAGSIGNLIARLKFVIRFTKEDQVQFCEVSMYPFERIEGAGLPLTGSGFIGYQGKITDDMDKRYAGERLYKTNPDDPTAPSLLEVVEPASWSKSRYDLIRFLQHTPKKKKQ